MTNRREVLQSGAALVGAAAGLSPQMAQAAWNQTAFEAQSLAAVVKALGGTAAAIESKQVQLQAPEIAENGAVVRVSAASQLPGTTQLAIVVEKNPNALAAVFELPAGTDASLATNIKMAETSKVYALAKAGDKYHYAAQLVTVTLGGCGN
jgi:sulfur-oxidizing protein SoxY